MRKNAFTMMELMLGIMILAITSTIVIVNVNAVSGQTAKREAEKLAQWLTSRTIIADSRNEPFKLKTDSTNKVYIHWGNDENDVKNREYFDASNGCTFQMNVTELEYSVLKNTFIQSGHIKVTGKEGPTDPYYVIIAMIGGRIRTSDTAP